MHSRQLGLGRVLGEANRAALRRAGCKQSKTSAKVNRPSSEVLGLRYLYMVDLICTT
jgi:hypothetical protein